MKLPKYFGRPRKLNLLMVRRVAGQSMVPALPPGRLVLAVPASKIARGDVVIILHDGLEKIKRVADIDAQNRLYVLGDNQGQSTDSRVFGWVEADQVLAKAVWPRNI
ncbi:MAG TPA: S26 family signal peptidase [Candidatus Saccharimonadales bacterium]|nr:S26 family signal peptidase [Candidatus Saccharimonadales bacterium]